MAEVTWWDFIWTGLLGPAGLVLEPGGVIGDALAGAPYPEQTTPEKALAAKKFLVAEAAVLSVGAIPALYALSLRSKRKLKPGEERLGVALENASMAVSGPLMVALAATPISTAIAYITVQKLEDAGYIKTGLGNAVQGLMAVSAAGPMIQGIGQIARSAFAKGK